MPTTRSRFQLGSLQVEGEGPAARYYTRFRVYSPDGKVTRKKVILGLVSKVSKREANKLRTDVVARETSQAPVVLAAQRSETLFEDFYLHRFLVMKADWSEPHRQGFAYIMNSFVLPRFGRMPLCDVDKVMVQSLLNSLAPKYSQSTIKHVRTKMVEVFEEAVEQEYITRNPASKTKIPVTAREPEQPILTEAQLVKIIDLLSNQRDKVIFLVGTFCAMRTSEVFGLPWRNFHEVQDGDSYFIVDQIAYRGRRYKRTKNDASKGRVPIGEWTLRELLKWKAQCADTSPDALIFPSSNRNGRTKVGCPMFPGIWLQKVIHPLATRLGIPFKVNFRTTRRTAASMVQEHGAALATAQSFLRHASPNTTATVYSKPIPDSVKVAVNSYEDRVQAARAAPAKMRIVR